MAAATVAALAAVTGALLAPAAAAAAGPAAAVRGAAAVRPDRPAALAVAVRAPVSAGQRIAAALHSSPLYIDPSLGSAFPPAVRASLLRQIRRAPAPVFILAVPLVNGGEWASGDQLATVVHNYLGRAGIYLTLDSEISSDIDAYTWPSDPQGIDAAPYHAGDAAQAANLAQDMQNATLPQKFLRCIELIRDGRAVAAANAAISRLDQHPAGLAAPRPAARGKGLGGVVIAVIVIALIAAGGGGWLMLRRRKRERSSFVTPHSVFAAARTATESELRAQALQQVIALGELVEQPGARQASAAAGRPSEQAQAQLARMLDAYQAAGKALDSASGICDLAGVLVLTHQGRAAAAAAQALQSGRPAPAACPLCFFNPLHGDGLREIHWRALGSRENLDVHVCRECATTVAQHRLPDVLVDRAHGQETPYYEVDRDRSVWAATGYGQFGDDLVQRILTQGIHPAR